MNNNSINSQLLLDNIINNTTDGIAALQSIRDSYTKEIQDFQCWLINPVLAQWLEIKTEQLSEQAIFQKILNFLELGVFKQFVKIVETGKPLRENLYIRRDNSVLCYYLIANKLEDGLSLILRDITQEKQMELTLRANLSHLESSDNLDQLTGVYNRIVFNRVFSQEWQRCAREYQPLSLVICDLDYFKAYNEYYSFAMGDLCLKQIGKALGKIAKRPGDVVTRYGGEEFALILPNTDIKGGIKIAKSIQIAVKQLKINHEYSGISNYITLSIGVASVIPPKESFPETLMSAEILLYSADKSLYIAKKSGRNQIVANGIKIEEVSKAQL
jgi:two-component system, cell cycle response regulator